MTKEQREIIEQCARIVDEAGLQIHMADVGAERRLMDRISRDLSMVQKSLRILLSQDAEAKTNRKPLGRLLNEGIL